MDHLLPFTISELKAEQGLEQKANTAGYHAETMSHITCKVCMGSGCNCTTEKRRRK